MMSQDGLVNRESLSALADGQLRGAEFARVVGSIARSEDALAAWHAYHVVGDVLRSADLGACADDRAFVARFRERLAAQPEARPALRDFEQTDVHAVNTQDGTALQRNGGRRESANDRGGRWKLLVGMASMAAVAVVAWQLANSEGAAGWSARLSAAPQAGSGLVQSSATGASASNEPPVMLRDPRLDELLAAHKQLGGISALQAPAGFLRNATFEEPRR